MKPIISYLIKLNHFDMLSCRNASECNEHHDVEITSARVAAEQDVAKNSEEFVQHVNSKFLIYSVLFPQATFSRFLNVFCPCFILCTPS